jgi:hypothetical protein
VSRSAVYVATGAGDLFPRATYVIPITKQLMHSKNKKKKNREIHPIAATTSWNFTLIDPFMVDFMEATKGKRQMPNFSTIPTWMFVSDPAQCPKGNCGYPEDPFQVPLLK